MDNNKKAYEALIKGIQNYIKETIDKYADKTYTVVVTGTNGYDSTYNINLNGVIYTNVPTIGGICNINETVRLLIPQGNYSKMVILK